MYEYIYEGVMVCVHLCPNILFLYEFILDLVHPNSLIVTWTPLLKALL